MKFIKKINRIAKFLTREKKLKNKVFISVSSEGYGHSSRAIAFANQLNKDEYVIATYDYALKRVKECGLNCIETGREVKFIGRDGSFDVGKTIVHNQGILMNFNKLIEEETKLIKKSQASCVVADGRIVPVLAAEKLKLPCINITNQSAFYPFFEKDNLLVRFLGVSFDSMMSMYLSTTEEILIPDFEPPYTICLYNLSKERKIMKRTKFVGPLVNFKAEDVPTIERNSKRPYIVISLGGHSYRKPIFDCILEVAKDLSDIDFEIFSFFETEEIPPNVKIQTTLPNIFPYLKTADLIISQAGHSTAMEILSFGKPSIIIPDLKQIEQENNAKKMAELEVCEVITHDKLSKAKMIDCIQKVMKDDKYKQNAQVFAKMAKDLNSNAKVANILREYAKRLNQY